MTRTLILVALCGGCVVESAPVVDDESPTVEHYASAGAPAPTLRRAGAKAPFAGEPAQDAGEPAQDAGEPDQQDAGDPCVCTQPASGTLCARYGMLVCTGPCADPFGCGYEVTDD